MSDPKFIAYWPYCEKCHVPYAFDEDEPFAHCKCGTTEWGNPRPYDWVPNPRTLFGPHLTHEECENLISNSDGTWHEDVFQIEGPALIGLMRSCRSSTFRPKHGVPDGFAVDLANEVHGAFWAMAQGRHDYVVSAFRMWSEEHGTMLVLAATEEAIYVTKEQAIKFFGLESDRADKLDALLTGLLNRRVKIEQRMFDAANGKRPMPVSDELRQWALELGTAPERKS